jgi:hypothetical protein
MQIKRIDTSTIKAVAFAALAAVALAGYAPNAEEKNLKAVGARAEQFLSLLRAQEWNEATGMVLLDDAAYDRFSFLNRRDPAALKNAMAKLFKQVYSNLTPGVLVSVRINSSNPTLASITYRHDDLDGFNMRLSNGKWYYSVQ